MEEDLLTDVNGLIEAYRLAAEGLKPIQDRLKDTSIALEARWAAYHRLCDEGVLCSNEIYGDGYLSTLGDNLTLYDDFSVDRHQTEQYIDMYEHIMEAIGEYQKELVEAREQNLAAWQEEVLASGYSSFTYDW